MWNILAALAFLAVCGLFGVSALHRTVGRELEAIELLAYGIPLGIVLTSLSVLVLATVFGFSVLVITLASLLAAVTAVVPGLWRARPGPGTGQKKSPSARDWHGSRLLAAGILLLLIAWLVLFWSRALTREADGIWAGHPYLWGDWARHLGDTASFAHSDNFPPSHPRFSGHPFNYHYLTSVTAAVMVELGMDPVEALPLQSFVFSSLIVLGLFAFACRLTGDRRAAVLTVILVLFGGGLGWWLTIDRMIESGEIVETLMQNPWQRQALEAANLQWKNVFFSLIAPQRSYLYGIPLGLLVLTLLLIGIRKGSTAMYGLAGVVAALLPFAHLGTLLALALITPFLTLLFPTRRWLWFFGLWALVGAPQFVLQQAGVPTVVRAIRFETGWLAPPDPWLWFWVKNLGAMLLLLPISLLRRDLMPSDSRKFLIAFMPLFVLANLVVFQPWAWDNTKLLVYWYLPACIFVAALLVQMGRSGAVARAVMLLVVATLILSGVLEAWSFTRGRGRHLLLTDEEIELAETIRSETSPRSRFVVGLQHNHPIPVLTGREVLMSYPGWHWSHGIETSVRRHEVETIYALGSDARRLLAEHRVSYLVIGPYELRELSADLEGFRKRYATIAQTENYEVFALAPAD